MNGIAISREFRKLASSQFGRGAGVEGNAGGIAEFFTKQPSR